MKEKTLRYPGHIELMRAFRETGFFSQGAAAGGRTARCGPLDVTATLLFPKWTFEEGEADLTVMRVVVEGTRGGRPARYAWDLLDRFDPATGLRSMSRTTAFPASIMARHAARRRFRRPGVHAPEIPGARARACSTPCSRELAARGVHYRAHHER